MNDFDITDIGSWENASEKTQFVWKDNTFFNEETNENITEKEFVMFIGQVIGALRQASSDEKIADAGLPNIITLIIDLLSAGISANNALLLVNMGLENNIDFSWLSFELAKQWPDVNKKIFDINDQSTWWFATENNLILEGKSFYISSEKKFSEILFVKIMNLLFNASLGELKTKLDLRNLTIFTLLDGLKQGKNVADILNQALVQIKNHNSMTSQPLEKAVVQSVSSYNTNNSYSQKENYDYSPKIKNIEDNNYLTPPSKIFLVLGIGLIVGGLIYLFSVATGNWTHGKLILGFLITCCSIPFLVKHSLEQSKFFYKAVCADMAQWIGHSSNNLIMKWGAPTKTYKFPSDKSMTVLEYKDSIRNYAGYRYKGMYAGQAKTTKYIKSFFVKNGTIVDYKYAVT